MPPVVHRGRRGNRRVTGGEGSGAAPCPPPARPLVARGSAPASPPGLSSCPGGPPELSLCPYRALVSRSCPGDRPHSLVVPQHLLTLVPSFRSIFPQCPRPAPCCPPQASHPVPDPAHRIIPVPPSWFSPLKPHVMFRSLPTFPQVSSLCPFPVSPQAPHPVLVPLHLLPCSFWGAGPDPHRTLRGSVTGTG